MAKYQVKTDCFAYGETKEKGCNILKSLYCRYENCKFYKPKFSEDKEERK